MWHSTIYPLSRENVMLIISLELRKFQGPCSIAEVLKWFKYFSFASQINKGHGSSYKQHPSFTET